MPDLSTIRPERGCWPSPAAPKLWSTVSVGFASALAGNAALAKMHATTEHRCRMDMVAFPAEFHKRNTMTSRWRVSIFSNGSAERVRDRRCSLRSRAQCEHHAVIVKAAICRDTNQVATAVYAQVADRVAAVAAPPGAAEIVDHGLLPFPAVMVEFVRVPAQRRSTSTGGSEQMAPYIH